MKPIQGKEILNNDKFKTNKINEDGVCCTINSLGIVGDELIPVEGNLVGIGGGKMREGKGCWTLSGED